MIKRFPVIEKRIEDYQLGLGDCLDLLPKLKSQSVDAVIADIPYGITNCKWDSVIPLDRMWKELNRVVKPTSPIVLFSSQPFTSILVASNIKNFKYEWVWDKVNKVTGFLNAKKQPLRVVEYICVFYNKQCCYNPIYRIGNYKTRKTKVIQSTVYNKLYKSSSGKNIDKLHPINLIRFKSAITNSIVHPTQKPVLLLEYLVETYTNIGDTVLDFTMGSGTTGIACVNLNRKFIGIEIEEKYFSIANKRILEALG